MQKESKVFQPFFYQSNHIRTIEYNGEAWWVASDVCKALDIENVTQSVARLDNDKVCSTYSRSLWSTKGIRIHYTLGGPQATHCVNEPGLYHLISKSRPAYVG